MNSGKSLLAWLVRLIQNVFASLDYTRDVVRLYTAGQVGAASVLLYKVVTVVRRRMTGLGWMIALLTINHCNSLNVVVVMVIVFISPLYQLFFCFVQTDSTWLRTFSCDFDISKVVCVSICYVLLQSHDISLFVDRIVHSTFLRFGSFSRWLLRVGSGR